MKRLAIFVGLLLSIVVSKAQTTALDFNRIDCNGNSHHLYSELDSNNVVILEFIMLACNTCNDAGQDLTEMHSKLDIQFPGKVRFYHFTSLKKTVIVIYKFIAVTLCPSLLRHRIRILEFFLSLCRCHSVIYPGPRGLLCSSRNICNGASFCNRGYRRITRVSHIYFHSR